jgi:acyl carrier protein
MATKIKVRGPVRDRCPDRNFGRKKARPPRRGAEEDEDMDTLAKVQEIIAEQLERPLSDVTPDTKLEDLGDSLDLIEVVYALEVAFKVDIPLNSKAADEKLDSVSDVGRIIDRLIAERDAA